MERPQPSSWSGGKVRISTIWAVGSIQKLTGGRSEKWEIMWEKRTEILLRVQKLKFFSRGMLLVCYSGYCGKRVILLGKSSCY